VSAEIFNRPVDSVLSHDWKRKVYLLRKESDLQNFRSLRSFRTYSGEKNNEVTEGNRK